MKTIYIIVFLSIIATTQSWCQISEAEYFIDTDPGVGNALPLSLTNGNTIDESFTIPTVGLSEGIHFLHIRVKGTNDVWSLYYFDSFYILNEVFPDNFPPITNAEYFIDNDPGVGNAQPLTITGGYDIDEVFSIPVPNDLSDGLHTLHIRVKSSVGEWSQYIFDTFTVDSNLSVADFNEDSFIAYPNPVENVLNISFKDSFDYSMQVIDLNGKVLLNKKSFSGLEQKIDFSEFNNGIYIVKLSLIKLNQTKSFKVVKL